MTKDNKKALFEKLVSEITENVFLSEPNLLEVNRLRDIVLQPAKDLANTVAYGAEKLSATFQKTVKGLSFIIPTYILPGLEFQYSLFAKDEAKRIDAIKKKYGEALDRNWEAIKDPDVFGFLMLAYPQTLLSFAALKKSPIAFLNTLEIATGGMTAVRTLRQNLEATSGYTPRKRQNFDTSLNGHSGGGMGGDYYGDYGGTGLYEDVQADAITQIQALLQSPEVQQKLAQSQLFKDMQAQAVQLFVDPVRRISSAKTFEDLRNFIPSENLDKAKSAIMSSEDFKKAPEQEKAKVLETLVSQIKATYKTEYLDWLGRVGQEQPQTKEEIAAAVNIIKSLK